MRSRLYALFACLIFLVAAAWPFQTAHAATFVVTNLNDSGAGSLRDALDFADYGDTITFQGGLTGTILLTARLNIMVDLTIVGPGAGVLALDGNDTTGIMYIFDSNVHISGLTFQHGYADDKGAGILNDGGNVTLDHCVFLGNNSGSGGGAIYSTGDLNISDCTFSNNSSGYGGGGAILSHAASHFRTYMTITRSAFVGNSTMASGGAIDQLWEGTITISNSTFSNNSGEHCGVLCADWGNQVTVTHSTLSGNSDQGNAGAIREWDSGSATLGNTIVAGNTSVHGSPNIEGSISSLGHNLIGNTSGSSGWVSSDQTNADPLLDPPADNGGPTPTQSLQLSSPAIAMGDCNIAPAVTTDQRGVARKTPACDVGAYEAAYDPMVRNTRDFGGGSLRYAVNYAAAGTTITFDPAVFNGSMKIIVLNGGGLTLGNLTIQGPGAMQVAVNGNYADTVFTIPFGYSASISGLTIWRGHGGDHGGGIDNGGTLTLANCQLFQNLANTGGGLYNGVGSSAQISNSTFAGNDALTGYGGGLYTSGPLTVSNSTFNSNSAHAGGGGLYVNASGSLTVANTTVAGNTTPGYGGGIYNYNGPLNLGSSIVSGNSAGIAGPDIDGLVTSLGSNLVTDSSGSSGLIGSDQQFVNPLLGTLGNYGFPTQTMSLDLSSPAIGMGNCNLGAPAAPVSIDQRGVARKTPACDVGAYEAAYDPVVRNVREFGGGSLRYAIGYATPGTTITFDPTVFNTPQAITLGGSPLVIDKNMTIQGPGAGLAAVDGDAASGVFTVNGGVTATISGLTVQNGSAANGGGLYNSGTLTMVDSALTNNQATIAGGGIYAAGGSLTLSNTTLSGNHAGDGGGLYNHAGSSAQITNSTFYGNSATYGGGLCNAASATLTLSFSTISSNGVMFNIHGFCGGGICALPGGTVNLGNTIVAGNFRSMGFTPNDINGTVVSQGYNLIGDTLGVTGLVGSDLQNVDALLAGALADNGGPTQTLALLVGSPAIDAAADGACPSKDQRGVIRPQHLHCDIGAVEALTITGSAGVGEAVLSYDGGSATADAGGLYTIIVPLGWNGVIRPAKPGYVFNPPSRSYSNVQVSIAGQNYVASAMVCLPLVMR